MAHVISVIRPTPAGVEKSMYSGEVSPLEVQDFCLGEFPGFKNLLEKCMFFILSGIVIAFARLIKKKKTYTSSLDLCLYNHSCSFFDNNVKINVFIIFSHKNIQDISRKPGEGDFDKKVD